MVFYGIFPVNQPYGLVFFAHLWLHLYAISEQAIDFLVCVVKASAAAGRCRLVYFQQNFLNDFLAVPLTPQPSSKILILNVAIAEAMLAIAKVGVTKYIFEELNHFLLREGFRLSYRVHATALIGLLAPRQ